jgi:hypothetical protein
MAWDICNNSTASSTIFTYNDQYVEQRSFINHPHCGDDGADYSYIAFRLYMGVCSLGGALPRASETATQIPGLNYAFTAAWNSASLKRAPASSMYLPHVNASYVSPQNPDPIDSSIPVLATVQEDCYAPNNCTFNGQEPLFFVHDYENDTCASVIEADMFANVTAGQCYRASSSSTQFIVFDCVEPHAFSSTVSEHSCARPIQTVIQKTVCGNGIDSTIFCTVRNNPVTPTSPASSNLHATTLLFALLLSFIALFVQ